MNDTSQFELIDPPTDGITHVCFSPYDNNLLLVSSWDKTLRLYNVEKNELVHKVETAAVILTCCFGDKDQAYYGGLDTQVYMIDFYTNKTKVIGQHTEAVSSICYAPSTKRVYSGSWDKTLRVWDHHYNQIQKVELGSRVFSMDLSGSKLAIAMADRKAHIYDITQQDMSKPWQERDISLRYMLKCIRLMPSGEGFAASSIEGRVAIEYFDMSTEAQAKKYAFKSHRQVIQDTEVVYPVNSLAFHPKYGTFATGGSDCVVNIWDRVHRKRVKHISGYPDEIASLAFNKEGNLLAIASSYTFDEGERDHAPDTIFIKRITETDVQPKKPQ